MGKGRCVIVSISSKMGRAALASAFAFALATAPLPALGAAQMPTDSASILEGRTLQQVEWTVTFTGDEMVSDNNLRQMVQGLQPGDGAQFNITLINDCDEDVDWWVRNAIQESMEGKNSIDEDGTTNSGGAYSYELLYHDPAQSTPVVLYTNASVGGDDAETQPVASRSAASRASTAAGAPGGLFNATQDSGMEDYFHLDTFGPHETRMMTLSMAIDGETHTNSYFDTDAGALIQYAAEPVASEVVTYLQEPDRYERVTAGLPQTGDLLPAFTMLCLLIGCALVACGLASYLDDRRRAKEDVA